MTYRARVRDPGYNAIARWGAQAAAAATGARLVQAREAPLAGLTTVGVDTRGAAVPRERMSVPVTYRVPQASVADATGLEAAMQADATAAGATLSSLVVKEPQRPIPIVDFTAADAAVVEAAASKLQAYGAALITVHDRDGDLLAVRGSVASLGLIGGWTSPSLATDSMGPEFTKPLPSGTPESGKPCDPPMTITLYATGRRFTHATSARLAGVR